MLTTASTTAAINAVQKPTTLNPETTDDASINISALMISRNIPKVKIESGNVIILRKSPIVAFINPMTTAAMRAVPIPSTTKPGII